MMSAKEAKAKTKTDFSDEAKKVLNEINRYINFSIEDGKYETIIEIKPKVFPWVEKELKELGYEIRKSGLKNTYYIRWENAA